MNNNLRQRVVVVLDRLDEQMRMKYMGRLVPYNPSVLLEELCQYLKTGRYNGPRVPETATTLSSDDLLIFLANARAKRAIMVAWQAGIAQGREIQKIESETRCLRRRDRWEDRE